MASYVLVYQNHRVAVPDGTIFVGRGIDCHVRFNAATVSRRHLRLELAGGVLRAENLSNTTGTLLNGRAMTDLATLRHGDRLALGPRELQVEALADTQASLHGGRGAVAPGHIDLGTGADDDDVTRPGDISAVTLGPTPKIPFHTCPSCRDKVPFDRSTCPSCGHKWESSGPSALTQRSTQRALPAHPAATPPSGTPAATAPIADVPVVYASDEMTIDAVAREIGGDGLFVPTELLDPEGTACEITILADGESAMTVRGVVGKVRASAGPSAPTGLEIRFTEVAAAARAWLDARKRGR